MTGNSRRWLPAAAVVVAVLAMAVAARRDGPIQPGPGHGLWQGARPAAGLAALVLLIVIAANFAKRRDDGYGVLRRAGTATAVLLTAAAVLTPFALLFLGRRPQPPAPFQEPDSNGSAKPPPPPPSRRPLPPARRGSSSGTNWIVDSVLILIVAAVLAFLLYVLYKLLARRWFTRGDIQLIEFDPLALELEELTEAVAAGTEALEYEGDAREAVIACYSAMEQAVSAGGAGRRATDTPEEFLRRVTTSNLIPDRPAARLTELFREARFSRHPIAESQRDEAREALREISEHVRIRAAERAAALARAKAEAEGRSPEAAGAGASATGGPR